MRRPVGGARRAAVLVRGRRRCRSSSATPTPRSRRPRAVRVGALTAYARRSRDFCHSSSYVVGCGCMSRWVLAPQRRLVAELVESEPRRRPRRRSVETRSRTQSPLNAGVRRRSRRERGRCVSGCATLAGRCRSSCRMGRRSPGSRRPVAGKPQLNGWCELRVLRDVAHHRQRDQALGAHRAVLGDELAIAAAIRPARAPAVRPHSSSRRRSRSTSRCPVFASPRAASCRRPSCSRPSGRPAGRSRRASAAVGEVEPVDPGTDRVPVGASRRRSSAGPGAAAAGAATSAARANAATRVPAPLTPTPYASVSAST